MYQVYKIGEDGLPAAALRLIKTAFMVMLAVYLLLMIYLLYNFQGGIKYILISAAVCIPAYGLALLLGYMLLKQNYRRFRFVLDDEAIELSLPLNRKRIKWANVSKLEKSGGVTEIHDTNVSAWIRILTGEGNIPLVPEIENRNELMAMIDKRILNSKS
ncbi:hypothetical protein [Mucilaginibacter sp.]